MQPAEGALHHPCSRCGGEMGEGAHVNVTMPTIGVVDLCGTCWASLRAWCGTMVAPRFRAKKSEFGGIIK